MKSYSLKIIKIILLLALVLLLFSFTSKVNAASKYSVNIKSNQSKTLNITNYLGRSSKAAKALPNTTSYIYISYGGFNDKNQYSVSLDYNTKGDLTMTVKPKKNKSFNGHFTLYRCTPNDVRGGILPTILKVNVSVCKK